MRELRYTLVCDGSSNEGLLPILTWLIHQQGVTFPVQGVWADLRRLRSPPRVLADRIPRAVELYPCDLLFIHRDAETSPREDRASEIQRAVREALPEGAPPCVCVVPVRMQEAWMLFALLYEALKRASGLSGRRLRRVSLARAARRITDLIDDFTPLHAFDAFRAMAAELRHVMRQCEWVPPPAKANG